MTTAVRVARRVALLVLPLALVLICRLLEPARGPLWLGSNSDPSYQYLISALLLGHGMTPGHVDHPGTTSQVMGAAVFSASAPGGDVEEQTRAVLANPESMLRNIIRTQWALACAALMLGGWLVLERTGSLVSALAVQMVPLLQLGSYRALLFFAPEALLLPLAFLLAIFLLVRQYDVQQPRFGLMDVALGITAAAGVVTKITFAPLCLLPLLLQRTWRHALGLVVVMSIAAVGFLLPIRTELPRVLAWFASLASHKGIYGSGQAGFIDWANYPRDLLHIAVADHLLAPVIGLSLLVSITIWIRGGFGDRVREWARLLFTVAVVQFAGILLVAKHPHHAHYLVPLAVSCAFNVGACLELAKNFQRPRVVALTVAGIAILTVLLAAHDVRHHAADLRRTATAQLEMKRRADATAGLRVDYYRSSSPEFALFFGDSTARHFFGRALDEIYPGRVFFNLFEARFETFRLRLTPESVAGRSPVILHGDRNIEGVTLPNGLVSVPIADNGVARLLRLERPTPNASVRNP